MIHCSPLIGLPIGSLTLNVLLSTSSFVQFKSSVDSARSSRSSFNIWSKSAGWMSTLSDGSKNAGSARESSSSIVLTRRLKLNSSENIKLWLLVITIPFLNIFISGSKLNYIQTIFIKILYQQIKIPYNRNFPNKPWPWNKNKEIFTFDKKKYLFV